MPFQMPPNFKWGVSTSAFESEGALTADGRGPSIWDRFCERPGMVKDGHLAEIAAMSYERWDEDVKWLKDLGVNSYRFSIAWPRVLPQGRGQVNSQGLDYYSRLVDALLAAKIEPTIMLYHWDLPLALHEPGGWQNRDTAQAFADYAAVAVKRLGDRVKNWMTMEEIATGIGQGYNGKNLAPGLHLTGKPLAQVYHHALVAHGLGLQAIRANASGTKAGLVMDNFTPVPLIEDEAHIAACRAAYVHVNGYLTEPIFHGVYPKHLEAHPDILAGDMELISQTLDFFGLSIYSGVYCEPARNEFGYQRVEFPEQYPMVRDLDWMRFVPQSLYWSVRHAHDCYGCREIYMTESGYATDGSRSEESLCNDIDRIMAMRCYLREMHRAVAEGVPVRGYANWSLVDDYEWVNGYTKGLGLCYLNRATGQRRAKRSFAWYQAVIRANAII